MTQARPYTGIPHELLNIAAEVVGSPPACGDAHFVLADQLATAA